MAWSVLTGLKRKNYWTKKPNKPVSLKRMEVLLTRKQHKMYGVSLILAPLLQFISGFFWVNKEYGVIGGTLLVLSMFFWIPSLIALFDFIKIKFPNYAAWGLLMAIIGFISGSNFAMVGVMSDIFDISHETYLKEFENYKLSSNILLFQTGPLAPLSLLILGIVMLRTKTVDAFIAILIITGAILFPVSRISRTDWIAHVCDIFLLVPLSILGTRNLAQK